VFKVDPRGNIVLPWGDTMLVSLKIVGEIPEGTVAVFAICRRTREDTVLEKELGIVDGRVTIALTNEESESIEVGRYHWDLRIVTRIGETKANVISVYAPNMPTFEVKEVAADV